jgi:Raf kinase inhibitor-like YbhB/YbcL family protein
MASSREYLIVIGMTLLPTWPCFTLRLSLPELPRHPEIAMAISQRDARVPDREKGIAVRKATVWMAVLGLGALSAGRTQAQGMMLTSPDIKEGTTIASEQVFDSFGCSGANISPELSWSGVPNGTKSLAVSIYDSDAPTGWWHWMVFNIPPGTTSLPKDAGDVKKKLMPKGAIQSRNDFGSDGYSGPCPPAGHKPHHYQITVFALDVDKLPDANNNAAPAALVGDLHLHTLAKATLTGLYGR